MGNVLAIVPKGNHEMVAAAIRTIVAHPTPSRSTSTEVVGEPRRSALRLVGTVLVEAHDEWQTTFTRSSKIKVGQSCWMSPRPGRLRPRSRSGQAFRAHAWGSGASSLRDRTGPSHRRSGALLHDRLMWVVVVEGVVNHCFGPADACRKPEPLGTEVAMVDPESLTIGWSLMFQLGCVASLSDTAGRAACPKARTSGRDAAVDRGSTMSSRHGGRQPTCKDPLRLPAHRRRHLGLQVTPSDETARASTPSAPRSGPAGSRSTRARPQRSTRRRPRRPPRRRRSSVPRTGCSARRRGSASSTSPRPGTPPAPCPARSVACSVWLSPPRAPTPGSSRSSRWATSPTRASTTSRSPPTGPCWSSRTPATACRPAQLPRLGLPLQPHGPRSSRRTRTRRGTGATAGPLARGGSRRLCHVRRPERSRLQRRRQRDHRYPCLGRGPHARRHPRGEGPPSARQQLADLLDPAARRQRHLGDPEEPDGPAVPAVTK